MIDDLWLYATVQMSSWEMEKAIERYIQGNPFYIKYHNQQDSSWFLEAREVATLREKGGTGEKPLECC